MRARCRRRGQEFPPSPSPSSSHPIPKCRPRTLIYTERAFLSRRLAARSLPRSQSPARAENERASEANTQEHVKEAASNGLSVTAGCCGPCLPLLTTSNLDKPEDGWMRLDDDRMNGHCDCTAGVECESHSSSPVFGACLAAVSGRVGTSPNCRLSPRPRPVR